MKKSISDRASFGRILSVLGAVFAVCGLLALGIPGASAYFTDRKEAVNTFTVGKIAIRQHEDQWDALPPEQKNNLVPGDRIPKDPVVENVGNQEAFVFQTVQIPCRVLITANSDGSKNPPGMTDLFSYSVNEGWTFVKTEDILEENIVCAHRYTYVYGTKDRCSPLAPKVSTPPLFDEVILANIVEGQGLEESVQDIPVTAFAIQTKNLGKDGTVDPEEVLSILTGQQAESKTSS